MVDLHCHILPSVDDGSADWSVTLAMCDMAYKDGIRTIVATPHANGHYTFDRERCTELLAELQQKFPEIGFSMGCDFHLSYENVQHATENPQFYTVGGGRFVMTELSDYATPHQIKELIFRLHCAGLVTVITHPERSAVVAQYPDLASDLVHMGSLLQITASAITGAWGRPVKKRAEQLLKNGLVAVIASDAHEDKKRTPTLSAARKAASKLIGEAAAIQLVEQNPSSIVNDVSFSRL